MKDNLPHQKAKKRATLRLVTATFILGREERLLHSWGATPAGICPLQRQLKRCLLCGIASYLAGVAPEHFLNDGLRFAPPEIEHHCKIALAPFLEIRPVTSLVGIRHQIEQSRLPFPKNLAPALGFRPGDEISEVTGKRRVHSKAVEIIDFLGCHAVLPSSGSKTLP